MSNKAKNTHLKDGDNQTKQTYSIRDHHFFLVKSKSPPHREHWKQKKHRKENNPRKKSAWKQLQTFY
nr:hypothetical protein [Legionella pneumophila]